ncbi:MAG: NAD(P)/FAD-dependent oxidoreductase [Proteobacteria bacterium]|nr:NAD(P)/FAD-dependent oxidoreductase [Pseudomonadota bacterium]
MTEARPTVVIGAGHNGLVAAAYLARAGRRVVVVEAAGHVGGAAVTREFAPHFRVSAVAHLTHLLDPVIVRELALERHGLAFARESLRTVALNPDGEAVVLDQRAVVAGPVAEPDRAAYAEFMVRMRRFAAVLGRQHRRVPPRLAWERWTDALPAAAVGLDLRRLGREELREFLRIVTMAIYDVADEAFESPILKGAVSLDAVLGTRLGARSGNSVFTYLHRLSGAAWGLGGPSLPRGGVGSVTDALAAASRLAGAEIRLASPVEAVLVRSGRAAGVRLAGGEVIEAAAVLSSADPHTTLLGLVGARHLEAEFAQRIHHLRATGTAAKLHLALRAPPAFRGVAAEHAGERLLISPSATYADEAFNPAKYRQWSEHPVLEITVPTMHDATLAPPGQHVLSAVVQYAPYDIAGGWDAARAPFEARLLALLEQYAPGIGGQVIAAQLLTPADIARDYRIAGGHWHHAELAIDQALMLRPVPGAARYATPIDGLYLCGAGSHPGGGLIGAAGRNAARVALGEEP